MSAEFRDQLVQPVVVNLHLQLFIETVGHLRAHAALQILSFGISAHRGVLPEICDSCTIESAVHGLPSYLELGCIILRSCPIWRSPGMHMDRPFGILFLTRQEA